MKYLIIGSGVAGISAAKELIKKRKAADDITIISDEKYPFYYRPRLIHYLSGNIEINDIIINDYDWFKKNDINLRLEERVINIFPEKKTICTDEFEYNYDKLLLANGAHSFVPPIPGAEKENVFTLRNVPDAKNIYSIACEKEKAVVIGGGLLGLESAYNLSQAGLEVTVIERGPYLLSRQLDKRGGQILQNLLENKGLNFILNANTEKIDSNGKKLEVSVKGKGGFSAGLVLLSTGIRSNISLVENTDIKVNNGIIVNDKMETNLDNIYAAGDVAEHKGRVYGIWPPAMKQGQTAGKNIIGIDDKFTGYISSYSLKVAGISLVSKGIIDDENYQSEIIENNNKYKKIIYDNDKMVGVILIGDFSNKKELIDKVKTN